jgi:uncharacterized protein (PEP-CTERM system associated)
MSETYNDNVALSSARDSDWITQLTPMLQAKKAGGVAKLRARYQMNNSIHAHRNELNSTTHDLGANGQLELLSDHLFLDANVGIRQQSNSALDVGAVSLDSTPSNRSSTRFFSIGPTARARFGTFARGQAAVRYEVAGSDSASLPSSNRYSLTAGLTSGSRFNDWKWTTSLRSSKEDRRSGPDIETSALNVNNTLLLLPRLSGLANVGYETNNIPSSRNLNDGPIWSLGLRWRPGRRTSLEAGVGERFFGRNKFLSASYRAQQIGISTRYSTDLSSTRDQLAGRSSDSTADILAGSAYFLTAFPSEEDRAAEIERVMREYDLPERIDGAVNFLADQPFLQRRLDIGLTYLGKRIVLSSNAYRSTRESFLTVPAMVGLPPSDFSLSDEIQQSGLTTTIGYKARALTSVSGSLAYNNNEAVRLGTTRRQRVASVNIGRQVQRDVTAGLRASMQSDRAATPGAPKVRSNTVSASLNVRF